jgi:hypothetical protein
VIEVSSTGRLAQRAPRTAVVAAHVRARLVRFARR